jgi:hypothetical protein
MTNAAQAGSAGLSAGLTLKTWATSYNADLESDWFFMRKYVAIQPSSSVGSSEFAYYSSGYLESHIFDTQISSAFGSVTFSTIGSGIALVKVRSGDLSDLSDASSFSTCTPMSSGYDMTLNNCVDDDDRYMQYRIELSVDNDNIVNIQDITLGYDEYDPTLDAAYGNVSVSTSSDFTSGTGTNTLVSGDSLGLSTTSDFSGNKYRLPVVFHNAEANERTNFQQKLVLNTANLISAGRMREDCGDIRVTTTSGTAVSYFLESGCNTSSTIIWVKIPSLAASDDTTLYVYYGASDLTSLSSANDVFLYYDTFASDPGITHSQWYVATGNYYDVSYVNITHFL